MALKKFDNFSLNKRFNWTILCIGSTQIGVSAILCNRGFNLHFVVWKDSKTFNKYFNQIWIKFDSFCLTEDVIKRVKELKTGKPIQEAVEGWCPVEGCEQVIIQRKTLYFKRVLGIITF